MDSVGAAWIFSEEEFIKNNLSFLSFGKLKGSYGILGNDQIGDYIFLNLYNPTFAEVPYQNTTGLLPNGLSNPYLEWERTRKLQFGVELGGWKDRIIVNANYARNHSSNLLMNYSLPTYIGQNSILQNFPAVIQNISWEFTVNTKNIQSKNFTWSSEFNFTIPRNKVTSFPGIESTGYANGFNGVIVGEPLGIQKVYNFLGVDPATGEYIVADKQGNPTSSPKYIADATQLVSTLSKWTGGLQNTLSFKGFQFDFLLQTTQCTGLTFNAYVSIKPGEWGSSTASGNQSIAVLDRWQKPGDIAVFQKYSTGILSNGNFASSNANYPNAFFLRVKNISLSWQLPVGLTRKIHMQNFRLFVQGQNVLTLSNYQGLDPEIQAEGSIPPLRLVTTGAQITF